MSLLKFLFFYDTLVTCHYQKSRHPAVGESHILKPRQRRRSGFENFKKLGLTKPTFNNT